MDGLEDFKDLQGNDINKFVREYRDALKQDYDSQVDLINQQNRNDRAGIMAEANKRGMMYSNFPERAKMQYQANTYLPNLRSAYTSYQTGLDKLRSNALGSYNTIKTLQDQIKDLNEKYQQSKDDDDVDNTKGDWAVKSGTTWFKNDKGDNIRFSTFARNNGYDATTEGYLKAAEKYLTKEEYKKLKRIVNAQQGTSHANLGHNANSYGGSYQDYEYKDNNGNPYLSDSDRGLINSLGLTFIP